MIAPYVAGSISSYASSRPIFSKLENSLIRASLTEEARLLNLWKDVSGISEKCISIVIRFAVENGFQSFITIANRTVKVDSELIHKVFFKRKFNIILNEIDMVSRSAFVSELNFLKLDQVASHLIKARACCCFKEEGFRMKKVASSIDFYEKSSEVSFGEISDLKFSKKIKRIYRAVVELEKKVEIDRSVLIKLLEIVRSSSS